MISYWLPTEIPELWYTYVAGIRVEKLITQKGTKFCIGNMKTSLIKFANEKTLYKFLTV